MGSIQYSYSGNYLMIDEELLSFSDAMSYCETNFATTLATLYSEPQNAEAFHLCSQSTKSPSCAISTVCWIGGYDIYHNNIANPQWIDGSNMNYTAFYKSYTQTAQFENKCIRMNTANGWHPVDCNYCPIRFLCNNYDKTIKGKTPTPTSQPIQILTINYLKTCQLSIQSLNCTQTVQSKINSSQPVQYNVLFNFKTIDSLQCNQPTLSITAVDVKQYLHIYVDDEYVNMCYDEGAGCGKYIECLHNYDLSMDNITNIQITILKSPQMNALSLCSSGNMSLNVNISISCQPAFITTLSPTKTFIKSKTKTVYDVDIFGNSYSILLEQNEETLHNDVINYKYLALFEFKNGVCDKPIFIVDAEGYHMRFTYISNVTIIANDALYGIYENDKQVVLRRCYDTFNVFMLDTAENGGTSDIDMIQITTMISFAFDFADECRFQFTLNVTVSCADIETSNEQEINDVTSPVLGYIIGIFCAVMVVVICVLCMRAQRKKVSAINKQLQQRGMEIEMNALQHEGIENFNGNEMVRNQSEGIAVKSKKKKCSRKDKILKPIEGGKKEYIGLDNDALNVNENHNQHCDHNQAPKAFDYAIS